MVTLATAAAAFQRKLDEAELPNCVIGGLALLAWGEIRATRDVDFSVLTNFEHEPEKIRTILSLTEPRISEAFQFAIQNRVVLGTLPGNVPVDIGLAAFDYEADAISRSVLVELAPSISVRVCKAEDLIIFKAFAGRPQDWIDIAGVVQRQKGLDWDLIETNLPPLLELIEASERMQHLLELRG